MGTKTNRIKKERTFAIDLLIGTTVFIIASVLGTIIATIFINKEFMDENRVGAAACIIQFTSALLGTMYVAVMTKRKIVPVCAVQLICFLAVLFAGTAIIFEGRYEKIGLAILMLSMGCVCSILITLFFKKRKQTRIPKTVYR